MILDLGNDKIGRTKLFEEFLQINGDWLQSSIVMNARAWKSQIKRGTYKWLSEED